MKRFIGLGQEQRNFSPLGAGSPASTVARGGVLLHHSEAL